MAGQTPIITGQPGIYDDLILGTCELPQGFGVVQSGSVKMAGEMVKIAGCDTRTSALLLKDPGYEYTFEVLFSTGLPIPQKGQTIAFPDAFETGISGTVTDGDIKWSNGQKMMSITAHHFNGIGSAPTVAVV